MRRWVRRTITNAEVLAKRVFIGFWDKLGHYTEAVAVLIVGTIFLIVFIKLGIGTPSDWAAYSASFVVAAVTVFIIRKASRQHAILIEATMAYLIHGGRALLDRLLGRIIGGRWHLEQLKPGDALFERLERLATGNDHGLKRRIAEAAPTLGRIDARKTIRIISILRNDWDERWHSDIRRRAVEALIIPVLPYYLPLIHRVSPGVVEPILKLRENDQIYTAFATIEALHEWAESRPKVVERLFHELQDFARLQYSVPEIHAINTLIRLLNISKSGKPKPVLDELRAMGNDDNEFVRVAAARNVTLLADTFPEKTLELMQHFAADRQPKYVRRPIATERSIDFIIKETTSSKHGHEAKKLLLKLINDEDESIREGVFDKIESLRVTDEDLCKQLCAFVIENEKLPELKERAREFMREFENY